VEPELLIAGVRPVDDLREVGAICLVEDTVPDQAPLLVALVAVGEEVVEVVDGLEAAEPVVGGVDAGGEVGEVGGDLDAGERVVEPVVVEADVAAADDDNGAACGAGVEVAVEGVVDGVVVEAVKSDVD